MIAVPFGAMAGVGRASVEADLVGPDDFAIFIILADRAVIFVGDEIMAIGELANEPGVAVRAGVFNEERKFLDDLVVLVHLDDAGIAGLADHRVAVIEPLKRVNLHRLMPLGRL